MEHTISKRLRAIVNQVQYRSVADIGTDHGYIPLALARLMKIDKAAACDINKGPLARAAKNIDEAGLSHIIETRLGSGLSPVRHGEFETAVIAGMGGMLIRDILSAEPTCAKSFRQLVLQPQRDIPTLRRFLHSQGYGIVDEALVMEDGIFYFILDCRPWAEKPYDDAGYAFGQILIDEKDHVLRDYIQTEYNKIDKVLSQLNDICNKSRRKGTRERYEALLRQKKLCEDVLAWL